MSVAQLAGGRVSATARRAARRDGLFVAAAIVMGGIVVLALFGPLLAPYDPDQLFVGPADLQHDLGRLGADAPFDYADGLQRVAEAARAAGKACGILLRDAADLPRHQALGYSHIAVDSDLSILRKAWTGSVTAARA